MTNSRAQQICEAVDAFLLRPSIRDKFFNEKNKFRKQSSRTPMSQMIRVSRELADTQDFDPATNPFTRPTIGQDAAPSWYDLNPGARMAPVFKRRIGEAKEKEEKPKGKEKGKDKKGGPPAFLKKKKEKAETKADKASPPSQEQVQQQDQAMGAQDQQALQQQQAMMQQQGLPPGQMNPQDMMAGGMPPQLPELPRDVRKDPDWEGNRANQITAGLNTYSQKVADRYNMDNDPLQQGGPRTNNRKMQMAQTRWGDASTRAPRNSRTMSNGNGGGQQI